MIEGITEGLAESKGSKLVNVLWAVCLVNRRSALVPTDAEGLREYLCMFCICIKFMCSLIMLNRFMSMLLTVVANTTQILVTSMHTCRRDIYTAIKNAHKEPEVHLITTDKKTNTQDYNTLLLEV